MAKYRRLWTALPKERVGNTLWISLCMTPRYLGEAGTIASDAQFKDWPATLRGAAFKIRLGSQTVSASPDLTPLNSALWRDLFHDALLRDDRLPHEEHPYARDVITYPAASFAKGMPSYHARMTLAHLLSANKPLRAAGKLRESATTTLSSLVGDLLDVRSPVAAARRFYSVSSKAALPRRNDEDAKPRAARRARSFHRASATVRANAALMRQLGFVIDLQIPYSASYDALPGLQSTMSAYPVWPGASGLTSGELTLETLYVLDGGYFGVPNRAVDTPFDRGFVQFQDERLFMLSRIDVDAAALGLGAVATIGGREGDRAVAAPPMRSAGYALLRTTESMKPGGPLDPAQTLARAKALETYVSGLESGGTPAPYLLAAEDLTRGVAVDVQFKGTWYPLCQRTVAYTVTTSGRSGIIPNDETWETLSARENFGDDAHVFVHPTVFQWEGWSLGAPLPGNPSGTNSQRGVKDGEERLRMRYLIPPGALPPLHDGGIYRFRGRTVDLAGNRVSSQSLDVSHATPLGSVSTFGRVEPIPSPTLALREPLLHAQRPDESLSRLVIRSENARPSWDKMRTQQESIRVVFPPRGSVIAAQRAGRVARSQHDCTSEYRDLLWHDGELARDAISGNAIVHGDDGGETPYLPDPDAEYLVVKLWKIVDEIVEGADTRRIVQRRELFWNKVLPFYDDKANWPWARGITLRLVEGQDLGGLGATISPTDGRVRELTVSLPKGQRALLTLSCAPSDPKAIQLLRWASEELPGVDVGGVNVNVLDWSEDLLLALQGSPVTPELILELVHAVEAPLVGDAFPISAKADDRQLNETTANVTVEFAEALDTVGKIDVFAEWDDLSEDDDPAAHPRRIRAHVSSLLREQILLMGNETALEGGRCAITFRHALGDTRHHMVRYQLVVSSRDQDAFGGHSRKVRRSAWSAPVNVRSTTRLSAVSVRVAVPDLAWTQSRNGTQAMSQRTMPGCRIYLGAKWHQSGIGEQLAVILLATGDDKRPTDEGIRDVVSQLGVDPLWPGGSAPRLLPENFGGRSGDVTVQALTEPRVQQAPVTFDVKVVPHEVGWDPERKLYYCDVDVADAPASKIADVYYPFVRLCVARYQANSVPAAMGVSPVTSDLWQIAPSRTVCVSRLGSRHYQVEILGAAHTAATSQTEIRVVVERTASILGENWYVDHDAQLSIKAPDPSKQVVWSADLELPHEGWLPWMRHRLRVDEYLRLPSADGQDKTAFAPSHSDVVWLWH